MKKYLVLLIVITISCSKKIFEKIIITENDTLSWYNKNIPNSIYLKKWYSENTISNNNEIIVATIDTQIDLEHEALKNQIWVNKNEIPNNGIDDDKNGYIDDVNGWNFLGKPDGGYFSYGNYEYTRLIREFSLKNELTNFEKIELARAKVKLENEIKNYNDYYKTAEYRIVGVDSAIKTTIKLLNKTDYTIKEVDSLFNVLNKSKLDFIERRDLNSYELEDLVFLELIRIKYNFGYKELIDTRTMIDSTLNRCLNVNFNERIFIKNGNNNLNMDFLKHNTEVSSILIGNKENKLSGFHRNIRLMPLPISVNIDEHDKDIAMAIYYAVDNGAKIINMSFGKEFSLKQEWVTEAFKYAEKHNVLLVHCSGNNRFNVDENPYYPSDYSYKDSIELVSNFINVGSISKRIDSTMVSPFSNYGKKNVDIFAPGEEIYVAQPENKYGFDSGTSLAGPMVSGTAALIWLYYPKLSVQEVKAIILESGVIVDKKVVKPGTQGELVPFSELSKTGKVLNVYNAMELAKLKSKKK